MREADAAPGEKIRQPGDGEQPGEDSASVLSFVDVSQAAKEEGDDEDDVGTAFGVDTCAYRGTHATCTESLDGSCGGEGAGVGDGEDREGDDRVEDRGEGLDAGKLERQDEWRVAGVSAGGLGEVVVVRGDDEAEEEERDHVEEGDTPEDLLGGLGDRLAWVGGFCGSETDKFSSSEGE